MWIALLIFLLLIVVIVGIYNNLIQLRNKVHNSWSQIDVQLQRRFDLIPNFVDVVKAYMKHEEGVFTKLAELRSAWTNADSIDKKAQINNQLSHTLNTIIAVCENYPDLKANQNFSKLMQELRETEDKIAWSRQFYNDSVTIYNTKVQVVPSNIVAFIFGFKAETLFKVENEEARTSVKVDIQD